MSYALRTAISFRRSARLLPTPAAWHDHRVRDDEQLLWAPPRTGPVRHALSRERIVAAAVEIADAEGLDALSMPHLARTMGSAPMSLYRHVPGKHELVSLMLDAAIGPPPDLDGAGGWRDRLAAWARANRQVFVRHPWTLPLVAGDRPMGPQECAWAETGLRTVAEAGLPASDVGRVLMLVNGYVRGAALDIGNRLPTPEVLARAGDHGDYRVLSATLVSGAAGPAVGPDDGFEFGLSCVLDGIERFVVASVQSSAGSGPTATGRSGSDDQADHEPG